MDLGSHPLRNLLLGRPHSGGHQRLGIVDGLAALSADMMSSDAYSIENVLVAVGATVLAPTAMIVVAVGVPTVLMTLAFLYRLAISLTTEAGGSYSIARLYLLLTGRAAKIFSPWIFPAVATASLFTDYSITPAISI